MAAIALIGGVVPGIPASKALAELAARSPGMRIGGTALKAKQRRAEVLPASQTPEKPAPRIAVASVLGKSFGPENPAGLPSIPGDEFPEDFTDNPIPVDAAPTSANVPTLGSPGFGGSGLLGGSSSPPGTGQPPEIGAAPPAPVGLIPEPSTWALLIIGFGIIGSALRRKRAYVVLG